MLGALPKHLGKKVFDSNLEKQQVAPPSAAGTHTGRRAQRPEKAKKRPASRSDSRSEGGAEKEE